MESKFRKELLSFVSGDMKFVMQCVGDVFRRYMQTSDFACGAQGGMTEAALKSSLLSVIHMLLLGCGLTSNDQVVVQSEMYLGDLTRRRFVDVAVQTPHGTVLIELKYISVRYGHCEALTTPSATSGGGSGCMSFTRRQLANVTQKCASLTAEQLGETKVTTAAAARKAQPREATTLDSVLRSAEQQVRDYAQLLYQTQASARSKPIQCVAVVGFGNRFLWNSAPLKLQGGSPSYTTGGQAGCQQPASSSGLGSKEAAPSQPAQAKGTQTVSAAAAADMEV